jgi:RNA polymerase sigma-70 factor (ECF subfamily)
MDQEIGTEMSTSPCDEALIVDRVRRLSYQFARRLTSEHVADDISQDVALECLMLVRRNRWQPTKSLEALVATMTWRRQGRLRREKRQRGMREAQYIEELNRQTPEWMDPAHRCEQQDEELRRTQALEELPEACRSAFLLVREQRTTHREAARRLGLSKALVTKHVARAEKHLADHLLHVRKRNVTPPSLLKPSRRDAHLRARGAPQAHRESS